MKIQNNLVRIVGDDADDLRSLLLSALGYLPREGAYTSQRKFAEELLRRITGQ